MTPHAAQLREALEELLASSDVHLHDRGSAHGCDTCDAVAKAKQALSLPSPSDWLPIEDAPKEPGIVINVRGVTPYRWVPYNGRSDQFRRGIKGRWQRANEYGWENAALPENGEFVVNQPLPAPPETPRDER